MTGPRSATEPFEEEFAAVAPRLAGAGVGWLSALRAHGLNAYRSAGWPSRRVEAWKYTRLDEVVGAGFRPAALLADVAVDAVPAALLLPLEGPTAVFVNGRFRPELSRLDGLPEGVEATSLAQALDGAPDALKPHLGRVGSVEGMPLAALNTAFLTDGLVFRVGGGVGLDRPLQLVSLGVSAEAPVVFHPRHLIVLGPGATATVVESHGGVGGVPYLSNGVVEIVLEEGAALRHYKRQNEESRAFHLAATAIRLADRAAYEGFVLQLGGRLARHEVRARIAGSGADLRLDGAYLADGERQVDNTTFVEHVGAGSRSRQVFKGVLDERARGVFQGKILVRPGAQKTDGHQLSRALLLSRGAEMDGKPELEIYADDVKCGHGAAVGALAEEALFYLCSRGIDEATARRMLIEAFLAEVVDGITVEAVRGAFSAAVSGWLAGRGRAA